MSEAFDDDLAQEQAILDRIEAANAIPGEQLPATIATGRPRKAEPIKLVAWRQAHNASIAETARRWSVSPATVKRLCRDYGEAAKLERERWQQERLDRDLAQHSYDLKAMYLGQLNRHLTFVDFDWFGRCLRAKGTSDEAAVEAAREAALAEAARDFRAHWERCVGPLPNTLKAF